MQIGAAGVWAALGFNRGLQHHEYVHKENVEAHRAKMDRHARAVERFLEEKARYPDIYTIHPDDPPDEPAKYVLSSIAYGFYGSFWYINPFFTPLYFAKECYRMEVFVRGLDGEKTNKYYNTLDVYV
jgi:hypothetical protein